MVGIEEMESSFLKKFGKNLETAKSAFSRSRERAKLYYRAYAGDPWGSDDRNKMVSQDRPPISYNYCLSIVNALLGKEMQERKDIKFRGVGKYDLRDQKLSEWMTNIVRTWWQQCDGHRHESHSFLDQLITGYGWGHVYLDMSSFPFRVKIEHVDPWEMFVDPRAKDDNLTDARWLIRERRWPLDEVRATWPDKAADLNASIIATGGHGGIFPTVAIADYRQEGFMGPEDDEVTIWEYQFRRREEWVAFVDPSDDTRRELSKAEFEEVTASYEVQEWKPFQRDVYYRCYIGATDGSDKMILQEPIRLHTDLFTYPCITGFRDKTPGGRSEFFGLMHLLYEPQMTQSKVLSTIVEMMARSNKNGIMFEKGAISNPSTFKEEFSTPGGMMMVEDGVLSEGKSKIEILKGPTYPQGLDMLLRLAINGLHEVSGITDVLMGTSSKERSNVLMSNYQDKSYTLLAPLTEPLAGFRIRVGRLLASYIQKYVPVEDIDRSIEDEGVEGLTVRSAVDPNTGQPIMDPETGEPMMEKIATPGQLMKQADLMDYDVVVDLTFATSTEKQSLWQLFAQHGVLQMLTENGIPTQKLFPFIFRLLPAPSEMTNELADDIERELSQQQDMQTAEGMVEAFEGLDPQIAMQVAQKIFEVVQQYQQQQGQTPQGQPQ